MKRLYYKAIFALFSVLVMAFHAHSQPPSWETYTIFEDSENVNLWINGFNYYESQNFEVLFLAGRIIVLQDEVIQSTHLLLEFDGTGWSPTITTEAISLEITFIHDYLGGVVYILNEQQYSEEQGAPEIQHVVYFDGVTSETLFSFDSHKGRYAAFVLDDEIYVAGWMDGDEGQYLDILKYSNGQGESAFQVLPEVDFLLSLNALVYFNNQWYVGGQHWKVNDEFVPNFYVFNGESWNTVTDVNGNVFIGDVVKTAFYQNKLVISTQQGAGTEYSPNTGRGSGVIFWDGSNWSGPQTIASSNPNVLWGARIWDMKAIEDDLYVIGNFHFLNGMLLPYLAKWDGSQWCGLQTFEWSLFAKYIGTYNGQIMHIGNEWGWGYHNRSYLHDGVTFSPCTEPVSVEEEAESKVVIYPNPASSQVFFETNHPVIEVEVFDFQGKRVLRVPVSGNTLNIAMLPAGVYMVTLYFDRVHAPITTRLAVL